MLQVLELHFAIRDSFQMLPQTCRLRRQWALGLPPSTPVATNTSLPNVGAVSLSLMWLSVRC